VSKPEEGVQDVHEFYISGVTKSFGPGTPSNPNAFLAKYASNGTLLWNQTWGTADQDEGRFVTVAKDAVFLSGFTNSFGPGIPTCYNAFITSFSVDGIWLWNEVWGGNEQDNGGAVEVVGESIYLAGQTFSFSSGAPTKSDAFLARYLPVLEADFIASTTHVLEGESVSFAYTGPIGQGISSYEWDFGDDTPNATTANPMHQYAVPGVYSVTLTISGVDGSSSSITKVDFIQVDADVVPTSSFTASHTSTIQGGWIQFTFTGTTGNNLATFEWDFGDSSANSTERNPAHQYQAAGTFTAVLTIVDGDGDTASFTLPTDITVVDAALDSDGDGITDIDELALGTNSANPDTDGDGYSDGEERSANTNPLDAKNYPGSDQAALTSAVVAVIVACGIEGVVIVLIAMIIKKTKKQPAATR
ncbi:MAG: PKD domain-containing protein, partial [Candidatus Lokiarchaeota archaeon]|nr:PKD domain-containing protein [Candidatus Lokiarchaeota archaeon]